MTKQKIKETEFREVGESDDYIIYDMTQFLKDGIETDSIEIEKDFIKYIDSAINKAIKQQKEEIREMIGESLSVDELKGEMGACYSTLNVQVAFKEGFNHKGKELLKALDNLD